MATTWDASWWEIPISLGMKVPIKPHWFVYGNAGVSIFKGGFDITVDIDEKYANVLATHVDASAGTVTDLSPDGGVQDTISFRTGAVGLNYGVGTQVNIKKTFAVFFELNSSGAAKTVYNSNEMKSESKQLFTALSSQSLAESDPEWFDKLAYPVLMQGASARIGFGRTCSDWRRRHHRSPWNHRVPRGPTGCWAFVGDHLHDAIPHDLVGGRRWLWRNTRRGNGVLLRPVWWL